MTPYLLHHLVEAAAARYPRRPALEDGARRLSYEELMDESAALARSLQSLRLRPGDRLGLWTRKAAPGLIALLATLRAGGVYVPLDPFAPAERLARLIGDCGVRILVADPTLPAAAALWPLLAAAAAPPRHVLLVPAEGGEGDAAGSEAGTSEAGRAAAMRQEASRAVPPPAGLHPRGWDEGPAPDRRSAARELPPRLSEDLAYVLYTSGSTGEPKGVMLSHAHAINFAHWAADEAQIGPEDRVAGMAPLHFDLSIFDLFATWSRGACLLPLDGVTARFPAAVAAFLEERRATVCYAVPSALTRLLPFCQPPHGARLEALRRVIFAGEVFPPAALRAWRERLPRVVFHNWYGPTETNVCAAYRLPGLPAELPEPLPIGRALPNFELLAGDEQARPVAAGEPGLLWARGPMFLGYWGDPDRAAANRVCIRGEGGEERWWYNTGDWARRDAEGEWRFEGRKDDLVKCRGYRVSLLEIQQTLLRAPGVRAAAVIPVGEPGGEQRLLAFVAAAGSGDAERDESGEREAGNAAGGAGNAATPTAADLRAWCARSLPGYMIPAIRLLPELPETTTGKVDREQLRRMAAATGGGATVAGGQTAGRGARSPDLSARGPEASRAAGARGDEVA